MFMTKQTSLSLNTKGHGDIHRIDDKLQAAD